jgi:ApaG protein
MLSQITHGIKVSVSAVYREDFSAPEKFYFLFSYKIKITNESDYIVQLLRRKWFIFDSSGEYKEIEGEGVIGQQPVIKPGDTYEYESACNLTTGIGKMKGTYLMIREIDRNEFTVNIPQLDLVIPYRMN